MVQDGRLAEAVQDVGAEYKDDNNERRRRHHHAVLFLDSDIVRLGDPPVSGLEYIATTREWRQRVFARWTFTLKRPLQQAHSNSGFVSALCSTMLPRGRKRSLKMIELTPLTDKINKYFLR